MKLYATVSSERASKGQGGSRQVEVLLQIDPKLRLEVGRLVMTCEDDKYKIYYYPINENCTDQEIKGGRVLLYETKKGEKEKGNTLTEDGKRHIQSYGEQHPLFHSAEMQEHRKRK